MSSSRRPTEFQLAEQALKTLMRRYEDTKRTLADMSARVNEIRRKMSKERDPAKRSRLERELEAHKNREHNLLRAVQVMLPSEVEQAWTAYAWAYYCSKGK